MSHGSGLKAALMIGLTAWTAPLTAGRPSAPVPPTQEIVVLDPNVDPNGNPAVIPRPNCNFTLVDIPPTVLVHRFYYTGDRSFYARKRASVCRTDARKGIPKTPETVTDQSARQRAESYAAGPSRTPSAGRRPVDDGSRWNDPLSFVEWRARLLSRQLRDRSLLGP
jgi:hypothetical protein